MRRLWNLLVHGRIDGAIGWCGQVGYWWIKPCPHYYDSDWGFGKVGCHWHDGQGAAETQPPYRKLDPAWDGSQPYGGV